ncbi:hypothetical protein ACF0H5_003359 [Mactra antiquata]
MNTFYSSEDLLSLTTKKTEPVGRHLHTADKMNSINVSIIGACALISCIVSASPVTPVMPLKHFSTADACLFLCNICFDNMDQEMMECANNICLAKQQYDMNMGFLKLGRICRNYPKLDAFVFGNDSA